MFNMKCFFNLILGETKYLDDVQNNEHVSKSVKSKLTGMINHDLVTGKKGSTPEPTDGNPKIWNELKDVLLDPYFAPLMAEDLSGLPQAMVYTVEQDVLKDEGILYAHRLKEAGNNVYHLHNRGGFHGLNSLPKTHVSSKDISESKRKNIQFHKEISMNFCYCISN